MEFRLSANQNVILANVTEARQGRPSPRCSTSHGVKTENQASVLHAAAMACPSLPTCGLGLAESERMLPGLIDRIEKLCGELGLGGEEIIIRSTGCPNGCARPYMAEIAFVGKAPGRYQVWLGGNAAGTRLNRVWKDVAQGSRPRSRTAPGARAVCQGTRGWRTLRRLVPPRAAERKPPRNPAELGICAPPAQSLTQTISMEERHSRSVAKAISWRVTGTLDTIVISFLITGQAKWALSIGFVELFTKVALYYIHERVWNRLSFGRVKPQPDYHI